MLLSGQRVKPAALEAAGFRFRDPGLEPALQRLVGRA
jgi:NAD dependent epimerase/dehydratase family enzyme